MKSNTKGKFILMCLCSLILLSFGFSSSIANYSIILRESSVNTSEQNIEKPRISTNGAFKIYWEANGTALTDSQSIGQGWNYAIISDGQGGAIIVYVDQSGGSRDIYAQKINSDRERLWGQNGTVICNATGDQYEIRLCTNGARGAIIAWADNRDLTSDIYAQYVSSDGKTHWGDGSSWGGKADLNGTVICNATNSQIYPQICSDGLGGAFITWQDSRIYYDVYAQRVSSDGTTQWGESWWSGPGDLNGTVICNATGPQYQPEICANGSGGAIITWSDERIETDVYAQYLSSDGKTHWGDGSSWGGKTDLNGTVICNAIGNQYYPQICNINGGGAIITWDDERGGSIADIYAQYLSSDGKTHWGESFWSGPSDLNGTIICNATDNQISPVICSDGLGGAFITWEDERGSNFDIYAQHVSSDGTIHWGDGSFRGGQMDLNGTIICNEKIGDQFHPSICDDGGGGAIIAWTDYRIGGYSNIYVQKVNSDGITYWGDGSSWGGKADLNGTVLCNVKDKNAQLNYKHPPIPSLCSDNQGCVIAAWWDYRGTGWSMYAQRVSGRIISTSGGVLPAADDNDDDDDETAVIGINLIILLIPIVSGIGITYALIRKRIKN